MVLNVKIKCNKYLIGGSHLLDKLGVSPNTHFKYMAIHKDYRLMCGEINNTTHTHLRIDRHDGEPITSWETIQYLKNKFLGDDVVAIEIYPKQQDLLNGSNGRHLWVINSDLPNLINIEQ